MQSKTISPPASPKTIDSSEAKTHLPHLLREVQAGQTFEISVRGQAVARLVPAVAPAQRRESAGSKMREFMLAQREASAGAGMDLREMLEDGRA